MARGLFRSLQVVVVVVPLCCIGVTGATQRGKEAQRYRYANRPDDLFPYARVRIYRDFYALPMQFPGAGRKAPEPPLEIVRLGFIGPLLAQDGPILPEGFRPVVSNPSKALFGRHQLWGAMLAVEKANRSGGYRGKKFQLVRRTDLVQWGQTSNELAQFAYQDEVWGIESSIDSNHCHVLNRAALKAEIPIVNAGSSDPTLTEHTIPWLVRCINDDRLNSYELLSYLFGVKGYTRLALLRVNDRDGRLGVEELIKGAIRLKHPLLAELRFENGDTDFQEQLERIRQLSAQAVVLWANPPEGAGIVRQMREMGMSQQVVGFDRLAHPLFLELAGVAAEGTVVASAYNPDRDDRLWRSFQKHYLERFGEVPDSYAAHGFDGMSLLLWAVRQGGLNRVRIRDALYSLRSFPGVAGRIVFDRTMNDIGRPWLARVEKGRFHYFRPPDWPRRQELRVVIESRPGASED
ncbi:MAG: ABC transporter substrate-binding protein [Acidobacteriota bacterium]